MLDVLSIANYRSLLSLAIPLGRLNVITGANGSGKSNLYRALRLLSSTATEGIVGAVAREGGLESTFWAGPNELSRQMQSGAVPIKGTPSNKPKRLQLGFVAAKLGYSISLGLPTPVPGTEFFLDPEIKRESVWAGGTYNPAGAILERHSGSVKVRTGTKWEVLGSKQTQNESILSSHAISAAALGVAELSSAIRGWRFYDHFRTDRDAPARRSQVGTRTTVLHHDGRDLAAALQTIIEIGHREALATVIRDAFPGASLAIFISDDRQFSIGLKQYGLLRPLLAQELSEGTLLYLLWVAALLTPRPPSLMVLNEPETSLHADLLPALARLIGIASTNSQIWVISHSQLLISELARQQSCNLVALEKELGQTSVKGVSSLEQPAWRWPSP